LVSDNLDFQSAFADVQVALRPAAEVQGLLGAEVREAVQAAANPEHALMLERLKLEVRERKDLKARLEQVQATKKALQVRVMRSTPLLLLHMRDVCAADCERQEEAQAGQAAGRCGVDQPDRGAGVGRARPAGAWDAGAGVEQPAAAPAAAAVRPLLPVGGSERGV